MEVIKIILKWEDGYSIGIDLIDAQHKHFFEIGNSAYKLLDSASYLDEYSKIIQIIDDLKQYARYHFKCEEQYMLQINYKNYYGQKIEHEYFIEKISTVNLDSSDLDDINQNYKFIRNLLLFIFDWLINHILIKDKLIKAE